MTSHKAKSPQPEGRGLFTDEKKPALKAGFSNVVGERG
ncbi:hypothetical protein RABR111495_06445 [Rahnella bruchi]